MRPGALTTVGLAACVAMAALAGCDSSPTEPSPQPCTFALSPTSVAIGPAGGAGSVGVTTGAACAWTARSDVTWITATGGTSVTGPGTFSFTVAATPDASARTASLTVAGQSMPVVQQGQPCAYVLSPPSLTFGAGGGRGSFSVSTALTCAWTVGAVPAWLSIVQPSSGSGNGAVAYTVGANPDQASRTASVTVGDQSHGVTQSGLRMCDVTLEQDDDNFGAGGGNGAFDVRAAQDCEWALTADAAWIRITDPAGGLATGNRRVFYTVSPNTGDAARTGTVTAGGKRFTITQTGAAECRYTVAPVSFTDCLTGGGGTVTVDTAAGCPWTAAPNVSWISIAAGSSGYGPGSIRFTFGSNYDAARQGVVEVRWPAPTAGQNVRVNQAGCTYFIAPTVIDAPAAGGNFSFDLYSTPTDPNCGGPLQDGCLWSAQTSAAWVTILSTMPSAGDNRVSFRVAANGSPTPRTAAITVRDRTVTIRQAGL